MDIQTWVAYKRWVVIWYDEPDDNVEHRQSFEDYEDAVIKAKVTGANFIYDKLEMEFIDL